jgi:hypothetical protein
VDGRAGGGCKAAAREKVIGYDRKGPKLLFVQSNPFPKAFETEGCVLCDFDSTNRIGREKSWRISYTGAND